MLFRWCIQGLQDTLNDRSASCLKSSQSDTLMKRSCVTFLCVQPARSSRFTFDPECFRVTGICRHLLFCEMKRISECSHELVRPEPTLLLVPSPPHPRMNSSTVCKDSKDSHKVVFLVMQWQPKGSHQKIYICILVHLRSGLDTTQSNCVLQLPLKLKSNKNCSAIHYWLTSPYLRNAVLPNLQTTLARQLIRSINERRGGECDGGGWSEVILCVYTFRQGGCFYMVPK